MQIAALMNEEQIQVPKPVQDALGVRPGDRIWFEILDDGTVLVRAERTGKVDLLSLRGILKPKVRWVTVEEMNETITCAAPQDVPDALLVKVGGPIEQVSVVQELLSSGRSVSSFATTMEPAPS